jgi:UDP-N-acetylmuramoylalanine--D-glutamate ligase
VTSPPLQQLGRTDSWEGISAVVAGLGVSGFAAADTLLQLGAAVTVVEDGRGESLVEKATLLEVLGADVRLGPAAAGGNRSLPPGTDVVVTSPAWRPSDPMLESALSAGVPVWGEVELAWRLRGDTPWLCLTGTNGKTTTVQMLASILTAAGLRTAAVGNVGMPVTEAVMDPQRYDVLAVELSSFQLHWTSTMSAHAAAVLNVAPDHLDWYAGSAQSPQEAYAADKARIYARSQVACVYNVEDPATEQMVVEAEVVEGARAIGFTLGVPAVGMLGLVDDVLADRAFVAERRTSAAELATLADISPAAPHNVANALAAAALARAYGVQPVAVRDGLRGFRPTPTGSPWSCLAAASTGSTTRRRPTRTPPWPRCVPTTPWCGSPADWPRAPTSTSSSGAAPTASGPSCCSAPTGTSSGRLCSDTRRMCLWWTWAAATLGSLVTRSWTVPSLLPLRQHTRATRSCWHRDVPRRICSTGTPPVGSPSQRRCTGKAAAPVKSHSRTPDESPDVVQTRRRHPR